MVKVRNLGVSLKRALVFCFLVPPQPLRCPGSAQWACSLLGLVWCVQVGIPIPRRPQNPAGALAGCPPSGGLHRGGLYRVSSPSPDCLHRVCPRAMGRTCLVALTRIRHPSGMASPAPLEVFSLQEAKQYLKGQLTHFAQNGTSGEGRRNHLRPVSAGNT